LQAANVFPRPYCESNISASTQQLQFRRGCFIEAPCRPWVVLDWWCAEMRLTMNCR